MTWVEKATSMSKRRSVLLSLAILTRLGAMSIVCIFLLPALTGSRNSPNLGRMLDRGVTDTTFNTTQATLDLPPLGVLEPTPNLLPAGTYSITLSLTTTALANCRWSDQPATQYASMSHDFQQGQGTTLHRTVVTGLYDLADRWFYARCQDLSTGRNPDGDERQTHLRVLGPWNGGYPRIANVYGSFSPELAPLFAGYDLYIPYGLRDPANTVTAIRAINPMPRSC